MIDPHVHLRDWDQEAKETVAHGLRVAWMAGLDAVFEMPNTSPALTSEKTIVERIELADKVIADQNLGIFHGLYAGITADPKQIEEEVVAAHKKYFPRVVGLKMFAGNSTGDMGIITEGEQRLVYRTLADVGFQGVLAVHCEKEDFIDGSMFNPKRPISHSSARQPYAEVASVIDQITFAEDEGFSGTLHICHISVPEALVYIEKARESCGFKITCGITPHHALMYDEMMNSPDGLLLKMNPPLRSREMQEYMLRALLEGRITWIETDHAPHTLDDKLNPKKNNPFASGIPVLLFYPYFRDILKKDLSREEIRKLTHQNIANTFKIDITERDSFPYYNLSDEYPFDPFISLKGS